MVRQAVEGHQGRMREVVWVALWSDISFSVKPLHAVCSMVLTSFVHCFSFLDKHLDYTDGVQSNYMLTYL